MTEVGSVTIYEDFKDRKTLTPEAEATGSVSSESHCDLSVTGVLHHSIFCIKIRSLPDLTISWSKSLIFSDKVLIVFRKASVNFWGIILCLWLRINNPSKFCMPQLYIPWFYQGYSERECGDRSCKILHLFVWVFITFVINISTDLAYSRTRKLNSLRNQCGWGYWNTKY